MRASTAYFVGAGTIIAAIAIGLGGGIVAGNIMNPITPKQGADAGKPTPHVEAAATTKAQPEGLQYLTGSQAFGAVMAAPVQARDDAKSPAQPDTQTQANAQPAAPQASEAAAVEPPKSAPPAKTSEQQASTEQPSSTGNAYAKARDADVQRAASERRRSERRERWAERRHYETRGPRERTDWEDVARAVREDSDTRDIGRRQRGGGPQIMLFGSDDD